MMLAVASSLRLSFCLALLTGSLAALTGCEVSENSLETLDDPRAPGGSSADGGPGERGSSSGTTNGSSNGGPDDQEPPVPAEEGAFEPVPAARAFSQAELDALASSINGRLRGSSTYSILIEGFETGQTVYQRSPDTTRAPASNTKLFTTAATLKLHGNEHRPKVKLYATAMAGNTITGNLVLVGEHDPATNGWFAPQNRTALDALAEELRARGITRVEGSVIARGEFIYGGSSVGTYNAQNHRNAVAQNLRAALIARGITVVGGNSATGEFTAPGGATFLFDLPSVSADVQAHAINVPSHNEISDMAMRHLGFLRDGASTYASGFRATEIALDQLGVARAGFLLNDGSGLSGGNRVSARHLVDLMRALHDTPHYEPFFTSLAVAGLRGTISGRLGGVDTRHRFWGKTGTLNSVITLSGELHHRYDGQRYLVALLANNVNNQGAERNALDAVVAELARNRRGGTGLPDGVKLDAVRDDRNGETVTVRWRPVDGATGYIVWRSQDGRVFSRDEARYVEGTEHRTFTFDGTLFVKVSALGEHGEGPASSLLGARVVGDGPRALMVDGHERATAEPLSEYLLEAGHDGVVAHAEAWGGRFDSARHQAIEDGDVALGQRDVVLWMLGREGEVHHTFTPAEQGHVRAYVNGGGRLLVSGSEVGYDLIAAGSAADQSFAREVLGIDFIADAANTTFVSGGAATNTLGLARFSKLGRHVIDFPDVLRAAGEGRSCLVYRGGQQGDGCIVTDTEAGGRVVTLGIPLESFDEPQVRKALIDLIR